MRVETPPASPTTASSSGERDSLESFSNSNTHTNTMAFPSSSRPTSPSSILRIRFGQTSFVPEQERSFRSTSGTSADHKGKAREREQSGSRRNSLESGRSTPGPFAAASSLLSLPVRRDRESASSSNLASARDSASIASSKRQRERGQRGSLLVAATDALSLKKLSLSRKKRGPVYNPPPPRMPIIMPNVIEIRAQRPDEEAEERERFRNEAAQALGVVLDEQEPAPKAEEEQAPAVTFAPPPPPPQPSPSPAPRSPLKTHIRRPSATPIPNFPSTPSELTSFTQKSSAVLKYYPPSSLRILALTKHWRTRFMVLTFQQGSAIAFLHLFKDESGHEIERLQITEDAVVFIAEEGVGGRSHVLKVGGAKVGANAAGGKKDNGLLDAEGRTMWFLHVADSVEGQMWINKIKNVILAQRTIRAGLGIMPSSRGAIEPRGDLDVMLSMRAQGIISQNASSSTSKAANTNANQANRSLPDSWSNASLPRSPVISQLSTNETTASLSSAQSGRSVPAAIKSLFTGRPRSSSRATSVKSESTAGVTSFAETDGSGARISGGSGPTAPGPIHPVSAFLDRRIVSEAEQQRIEREAYANRSIPREKEPRAQSLGEISLKPAPRRRWLSQTEPPDLPASEAEERASVDSRPSTSRTSDSFSYHAPASTEPGSTFLSSFSFGSPEQKPRATSISSVSTIGSMDKRSVRSSRRWSRQLPLRLTPPSGPPPAVPGSAASSTSRLQPHPYANGDTPPSSGGSLMRPVSRTSSTRSGVSGRSMQPFSKRASISSAASIRTTSTSHSQAPSAKSITWSPQSKSPGSSLRASMPPPKPAPTFALPPAPDHSPPPATSASPPKARAFRLSLMATRSSPPSSHLPPRPDEVIRESASNATLKLTASPLEPLVTPTTSSSSNSTPSILSPKPILAKQRLRIMSEPSHDRPMSFLQLQTPSTPTPAMPYPSPPPPLLHDSENDLPELVSLPPPPRRSSRSARGAAAAAKQEEANPPSPPSSPDSPSEPQTEESVRPPLAHNISLVSLGVNKAHSMREVRERKKTSPSPSGHGSVASLSVATL